MKGPILVSNSIDSKVVSNFSDRLWFVPATIPEKVSSSSHSANWSDHLARFVYRQPRQRGRYVQPLPYDAYSAREITRPTFACRSLREYRNLNYPGGSSWAYDYYERKVSGTVPGVPWLGIPKLPEPTPEGALVAACLEKARNTSINIGVTLAEMNKSMSMISSRTRKLARAITKIRQKRFRSAANELGIRTPRGVSKTKSWSNNFLEYNYGWMPLVMDVVGIAQYLAEFLRTQPVLTVSARVEQKKPLNTAVGTYRAFAPHASYIVDAVETVTLRRDTTRTEYHQVVLNFGLQSHFLRELEKLGSVNPLSSAWELVPYSFVLDWFVNVSDVISAFTAPAGLEFLSGSYTRMAREEQIVTHLGFSAPAIRTNEKYISLGFTSTNGLFKGHNIRRSVYGYIPPPEMIIAIPGTQQWKKSIVSAALLRQRFS